MSRLSLITALLLIARLLPGTARSDDPPAEVSVLIEQLDDTEFARREAAVEGLSRLGVQAVEPLVKAATGTSPEVTSRAIGLLERLMETRDPGTVDAADDALVTLMNSDDPRAASLADATLARKALVREERAIAKIKELGGQVQVGPQVLITGQPLPGLDFEQAREHRPRVILISKDWKGGVEGLAHFRKLAHIPSLTIYVEKGAGVPLEQAQALASVLPGLQVHHRGPYLGVGATSDGQIDCVIDDVKAGGPADKAGLQRGDRVLALEQQTVRAFHDLVDALKQYDIGDTVTITVERLEQRLDVKVKLEPWALPTVTENVPLP